MQTSSPDTSQGRLSYKHLRALVWLEAITIAPLLFSLHWILALLWLLVGTYRLHLTPQQYQPPNTFIKLIVGIGAIAAIIIFSTSQTVIEIMFSILALSVILKTLEVVYVKDALPIIFISLILIAANLLFNQSIAISVYALLNFGFLLCCWRFLSLPESQTLSNNLHWSLGLILKAIPIFLFLYVTTPRLPPLWNLPGPHQATTGFSDELDLQNIASLAQNTETAFRVSFDNHTPRYADLYWRGINLTNYDGIRWHAQSTAPSRSSSSARSATENILQYQVLLEPHFQTQLFHLNTPISVSSSQTHVFISSDDTLLARRPISNRLSYTVSSSLDPATKALSPTEHAQYVYLPAKTNPNTHELIQTWINAGLTQSQIIERALALFAQDFRYSLTPPRLGKEQIDSFLFDTKSGFCGHYASSLAFMLRIANIPTRVVMGYMGGEHNPYENFYRIKQSDAHAWVEAWIDEGWIRLDPTAVVAPERITDTSLSDENSTAANQLTTGFSRVSWLNRLATQWDALDYAWQRFILDFNRERQSHLLSEWFGERTLWYVGIIFVALISLSAIMTLLPWRLAMQRQTPAQRAMRALKHLLSQLKKRGYTISPEQTPDGFLLQLAKNIPAHSHAFENIVREFRAVVYADHPEKLAAFTLAIKSLPLNQVPHFANQQTHRS